MIGKYLLTFRITVNILPLKRDMVVTVLHRPLLHCSQETSSLNYLNTLFVLTYYAGSASILASDSRLLYLVCFRPPVASTAVVSGQDLFRHDNNQRTIT